MVNLWEIAASRLDGRHSFSPGKGCITGCLNHASLLAAPAKPGWGGTGP